MCKNVIIKEIEVPVGLWEVFKKFTDDDILSAIPFSTIEKFCEKMKKKYGVDADGHTKINENIWKRKRNDVFSAYATIDSCDIDLSKIDDDDLIDECDKRGLNVLDSCDDDDLIAECDKRGLNGLESCDDDDLIDECEGRGLNVLESKYLTLKDFLEIKYDIMSSTYSDQELAEILIKKIKDNK